ncbi:hypothetical protein [Tepidibacter sp. Z1-5]|uniref:hypothetical protein n=1 Tax=Tepidibacter sp. Z1-5 TaxID=3134138 RepID=UPI0030C34BAA
MSKNIEVVLNYEDKEKVRELMEDSLVQIIVDRMNKFPEGNRGYIYDEILERLKKSL